MAISRSAPLGRTGKSYALWGGWLSPILAFQIAQGAAHTSNWKKYALRLLVFGLVSELPYDLALHGGVDWTNQNVYFTLLLGLLAIEADMKWTARDWKAGRFKGIVFAALLMLLAFIIGSDYGGFGVLMIYWFYLAGSDSLMMAGGLQPSILFWAGSRHLASWL